MKILPHIFILIAVIYIKTELDIKANCNLEEAIQNEIFNVGFAAIDLNPKIGIPLAGYGSPLRRLKPIDLKNRYENCLFFKPSEGFHTPIRAKSMVIESKRQKLVFISIDVIGVEYNFIEDICFLLSKYGINEEDLIVSATHTHSGPGTLSRRIPLELVAVDLFKQENYDMILDKVTNCVIEALNNLEPAILYSSSFKTDGLQINKFRKVEQNWYNPIANLLLAKSVKTDHWLGGIVNYSVHGGGMPIDTLLYSSDFPGQIEMRLEDRFFNLNKMNKKPVFLFTNGAEGDVATPSRGTKLIEELGKEFIIQADTSLKSIIPLNPRVRIYSEKLWLGIPTLPLKYSSRENSFLKKSPFLLRLCLYPTMPQYSYISVIEIGNITILTWPGEPSTELGFELQTIAKKNGYMNPWIFSLTNDYVSYFTTKEEYHEGNYDASSSIYNFRGGNRILRHYNRFLKNRKR